MPLVIGLLLLAVLVLAVRWFTAAPPAAILRTGLVSAALLAVAAVGLLIASGRGGWLLAALGFLAPWLVKRLRQGGVRGWSGSSPGKAGPAGTSAVETRFLAVSLDHASGTLTGHVKDGPFRGRALSDLSFDEALELWRQCAADPQSVQLIEAWLDRTWSDWRTRAGSADQGAAFSSGAMSRAEAYAILGLAEGASPEAIKAAHRRLMGAAHPDHGGSTYLAAKINQAKDVLLGD